VPKTVGGMADHAMKFLTRSTDHRTTRKDFGFNKELALQKKGPADEAESDHVEDCLSQSSIAIAMPLIY
jgi:hypothetical protein